MPFEKYTPPRKRKNNPIVTITENRLQLNKECQKFFKNINFAELYYDQVNRIIGIKPKDKETNDAVKINRYSDRSIAVLAATHFIKMYGLGLILNFDVRDADGNKIGGRSIQFIAEWNDSHKMVLVKLK